MSVTFLRLESEAQLAQLADMAAEIWNEYWPARIGQAQTDYMVKNFQSLEAIKRDVVEHDYEYWFICSDTETARDAGSDTETARDAESTNRNEASAANTRPADADSVLRIVGYTGGHVEPETNRFFISKIYLLESERGKGYAGATIGFYENLCQERGLDAMYLTVNKYNELGIRAYLGKGFETIASVETDIGEGFIMDDFVMEKRTA